MDSVINGEVSEESTDKEKASDLSTGGNYEPVVRNPNPKDDHLLNNNLTQSLEGDTSDNIPHNTSKNEESIPQKNDSADNVTKQIIANNTKSNHSVLINSDIDSNLLNTSEDEKCINELRKNSLESEGNSTEIQKDSFSASVKESSGNLNCSEQPHESQSCTKAVESNLNCSEQLHESQSCTEAVESNLNCKNIDSSVLPSNTKSIICQEPVSSTNDPNSCEEKSDAANRLDSVIPSSSSETADNPLSKDVNKSPESVSKSSSSLCENFTEKINDDISNSLIMPAAISSKGHNNSVTYLESKLSDFDSAKIEKDAKSTESSPLEQLNQHLKSIGCNDGEVANCGFSKANAQDADSKKTESLKMCQKDSTSVDRLKQSDSFVFTEISKEETGFPDIFTGLVVIGKYISVKGDFTLRSSEALIESPSLIAPYLLKEPDSFPPRLNDSKLEQRDFFHSTAGEMLIGIGLSRVSEWFHRDMTRIKKRQMKKEGKSPQLEEDLKMHEMFYNESRKANKIYSFALKACETCGFATESSIVMEGHLLVPHVTPRREYQCNFCEAINRDPKAMLEHMYRTHGKTGRIQPPVLFFECPYCTFESNSKVKLGNHLTKCQRYYDPNRNQAPPKEFEFPALTPKPITVAVVKSYEKTVNSMQRGRGRPKKIDNIAEQMNMNQYASNINHGPLPSHIPPYRPSSTTALSENLSSMTNQMISPLQMPSMNLRPTHSNLGQLRPSLPPPMHLPSTNRFYQVVNSTAPLMPMLGNSPLVTSPSQFPYNPNLVSTNSVSKKVPTPTNPFLNSFFGSGLRQQNPSKSIPEVTITPLPKLHGPYPVPAAKSSSTSSNNSSSQSNSLVVCEICDGYIKDLEQLRSHMQLIHKVKIHPKMLVSRPPLNCQKCQWRFFTDQGLERHLLGAHGLVTSNMQELANKNKDAGCCTICGRVYATKLVSHMNQVHKLTLKPAHLSYKCTVCSATFNLYRLFENHVYLVHSGAAKRPADNSSNSSKKFKSSDDNVDSHIEGEPKNHTEKRIAGESLTKCTECGNDFRKHAAQIDKCEKCLKSDVNEGTHSSKMS